LSEKPTFNAEANLRSEAGARRPSGLRGMTPTLESLEGINMFDDKGISQKEKREVLANDRKVREATTYHSVAQASVDDERGGRYATEGSKQTVVGSSPIAYPRQPENSPWHHDPCPPEPPLGYSVDEQEPVGEVFEREASAASTGQDAGDGDGPRDGTSPRPVTNRFPRRA
jgi:hypothetical protein